MNRKSIVAIILVLVGLFMAPMQSAFGATVVNFDQAGTLTDIDSFQFSILGPSGVSATDFFPNFPAGWLDLSGGNIVAAADFSVAQNVFLQTGQVGSFTNIAAPVNLGLWVLASESRGELTLGQDFFVQFDGTNYTVSAVPIPAAVWLLGSGVVGLVVLKRRKKA